ncbi:hypothetical protein M1145_03170 [Patescibacteria group bacterium]|nr:hypothetical protein [Patescibacteria group bacterium]
MHKTALQIPVNKSLKDKAEIVALSKRFSSLQEFIRIFLVEASKDNIDISFGENTQLSNTAEKRYLKIDKDFKNNKNIYEATNAKDLMKQLHKD